MIRFYGQTPLSIGLITCLSTDDKTQIQSSCGLILETDTNEIYKWESNSWTIIPLGGDSPSWGTIFGTLSNQSDLQSALDLKSPSSHTHPSTEISDSTATGRSLVTAADAAAVRTTAALGNSATRNVGTLSSEVLQGDALSNHVAAADPHTAYQRESEKAVANGYASLGADGLVPSAQLPAGQGGAAWGDVTGTLSDQTDLQSALDLKAALISPSFTTPALGTPSSGVLTSCTGTAAGLTAGTVTTNANLTGHITSTGNAAVLGSFTIAQLNTALSNADVSPNTSTAGVGTSPTSSSTTQVTHGLSRTPTIIRIYGKDTFVANAAALPPTGSIGIWCSSGNRCIYQPYDGTTITAAEPAATSTAYAIRQQTGVGNFITGVIGNVGATTFDIVWTETGTHTAQVYLWEAQ